jgi:hypothetical protein
MSASALADSVFVEVRFWLLIFVSLVLPCLLYAFIAWRRSIRRGTVFAIGVALVVISTIDVALLQVLADMARHSPSLADDAVFSSELTIALYTIPILFGGLGVNIVSHLLIEHLTQAERRHEHEHRHEHEQAP